MYRNITFTFPDDCQLSQAEHDAIAYLSTWCLSGYNNLRLSLDKHREFGASYLHTDTDKRYFIAGIFHADTGKYSFHS